MTKMIKKYKIGLSVALYLFSFNIQAESVCPVMPSCESMGYTATSCPDDGGSLVCPFDSTKLRCVTPFNTTCAEMGYRDYQCSDTQNALHCPNDYTKVACTDKCSSGNYPLAENDIDNNTGIAASCKDSNNTMHYKYLRCKPGYRPIHINEGSHYLLEHPEAYDNAFLCVPELKSCDNAEVGDFYVIMNDGTGQEGCVSPDEITGQKMNIIGVVADTTNKLVISGAIRNQKLTNNSNSSKHITGLMPYGSSLPPAEAVNDADGLYNTRRILTWANDVGETAPAVENCYQFETGYAADNHKQWFLPSANQMQRIINNLSTINASLNTQINKDISRNPNGYQVIPISNDYPLWTSTEQYDGGNYLNLAYDISYNGFYPVPRNQAFNVLCAFSYGENAMNALSEDGGDGTYDCATGPIQVGDIYYADDTCGHSTDRHKADEVGILGVVVDPQNHLVVEHEPGRDYRDQWGDRHLDTPVPNRTTEAFALRDMNGARNTSQIISYHNTMNGRADDTAAYVCDTKTDGDKSWFLPSLGQLNSAFSTKENFYKIQESLTGSFDNHGERYWASTEKSEGEVWVYYTHCPYYNNSCYYIDSLSKDERSSVACFFSF